MSYIKKLEEDYNNEKISSKKIDEQREFYYKLSKNERKEIDKKYGSDQIEKNKKEINSNDTTKDEEGEFKINYYFMWLFSCGFFGVIFFVQQGSWDNYTDLVLLDLFISFLSRGFLPILFISLICFPIKIFSKINFGKLLFWTSIIMGTINLLNGTFSKF
jgi:hypothetical protein